MRVLIEDSSVVGGGRAVVLGDGTEAPFEYRRADSGLCSTTLIFDLISASTFGFVAPEDCIEDDGFDLPVGASVVKGSSPARTPE